MPANRACRTAIRLVGALSLLLCAGCAAPNTASKREVRLHEQLGASADILPQLRAQLPASAPFRVVIRLTYSNGQPAAGANSTLRWSRGKEDIVSDSEGIIRLELSGERYDQPVLLIPATCTAETVTNHGPPVSFASPGYEGDWTRIHLGDTSVRRPLNNSSDMKSMLHRWFANCAGIRSARLRLLT